MMRAATLVALALLGLGREGRAEELQRVVLATTPWIESTGLIDHLVLAFQSATKIHVQLMPSGDGVPFESGRSGESDVLLVPEGGEAEAFVRDGFGADGGRVFQTGFVLLGPEDDPAKCAGLRDAAEALRRIAASRRLFVSRGDNGVSHRLEQELWRAAGVDPLSPANSWYRSLNAGANAAFELAAAERGYVLVSRLTWARHAAELPVRLISEADPRLARAFHVIRVLSSRSNAGDEGAARRWISWLTDPEGQAALAAFRLDGRPIFFPLAGEARFAGPGW